MPWCTRSTSAASPTSTGMARATSRGPVPARPSARPRCGRAVAHALLHVPAGGRRLRRGRLPRRRSTVRHAGRLRRPCGGRPRARVAADHRHRPEPFVRPAPLVPGGAGRAARVVRTVALHFPSRQARRTSRRGAAAERLAVRVRRSGVDAGERRRVVPASVRARAAGLQLAQPRGAGRVRGDPAILARPRCGRFPHRRGRGPLQGRFLPRPGPERPPRPERPDLQPSRSPRRVPQMAADPGRVRRRAHGHRRSVDGRSRRPRALPSPRRTTPGFPVRPAIGSVVGDGLPGRHRRRVEGRRTYRCRTHVGAVQSRLRPPRDSVRAAGGPPWDRKSRPGRRYCFSGAPGVGLPVSG